MQGKSDAPIAERERKLEAGAAYSTRTELGLRHWQGRFVRKRSLAPAAMGAEDVTEHRGIEAIKRILYGAGQPHEGTGIESYDIATNRFHRHSGVGGRRLCSASAHSTQQNTEGQALQKRLLFRFQVQQARQDPVPYGATLRSTGTRSMPIKFFSITGISNQLTRRGRPNVQSHK